MIKRLPIFFGLLFLTACVSQQSNKLETSDWLPMDILHQAGTVYLGGQPSEADYQKAAASGLKTVINLREPGEVDWDEKAVVENLGMHYQDVPFKAPETLTDEVFDQVRAVLKTSTSHPAMIHCKSANRVGAVWLTYRVLDEGVELEQAVQEAKKVGLKSPDYERLARDYIARSPH